MIWISFGKWNTVVKWRGDLRIRKRRIRTQRGKWTPFVLYDFAKYQRGGNRGDADGE
jgi:hypothetical protein